MRPLPLSTPSAFSPSLLSPHSLYLAGYPLPSLLVSLFAQPLRWVRCFWYGCLTLSLCVSHCASLTLCVALCFSHSLRLSLCLSVCLSVFHRVPQTPLTLSLSDGCVGWGYSGPRNQTGALMVTFKNTTDEVRGGGSNCWAFRKYFPTGADAYRTGYHFQPPKNWMNDPNGAYTGCW